MTTEDHTTHHPTVMLENGLVNVVTGQLAHMPTSGLPTCGLDN